MADGWRSEEEVAAHSLGARAVEEWKLLEVVKGQAKAWCQRVELADLGLAKEAKNSGKLETYKHGHPRHQR